MKEQFLQRVSKVKIKHHYVTLIGGYVSENY